MGSTRSPARNPSHAGPSRRVDGTVASSLKAAFCMGPADPARPLARGLTPSTTNYARSASATICRIRSPRSAQSWPPTMFSPSHSKPRHRYPHVQVWTVAGVFFLSTLSLGLFSYHQTSSAKHWHSADVNVVAKLATAHSSIESLNSRVSTLNGQVTSLNPQLSALVNAKEKALDHDAALRQLVGGEGRMASELNTCVADLQTVISTVATYLGNGYDGDPNVSEESVTASADCTRAQSDEMVWRSLWRPYLSTSATRVMTRFINVPGREMADRLDRLTRELSDLAPGRPVISLRVALPECLLLRGLLEPVGAEKAGGTSSSPVTPRLSTVVDGQPADDEPPLRGLRHSLGRGNTAPSVIGPPAAVEPRRQGRLTGPHYVRTRSSCPSPDVPRIAVPSLDLERPGRRCHVHRRPMGPRLGPSPLRAPSGRPRPDLRH